MNKDRISRTTPLDLKALEARVDALIDLCAQLQQENRVLQDESAAARAERDELRRKNELACTRLEEALVRVKQLEQES